MYELLKPLAKKNCDLLMTLLFAQGQITEAINSKQCKGKLFILTETLIKHFY